MYLTVIYLKCKPISNSSYQQQNEDTAAKEDIELLPILSPQRAQIFKRWSACPSHLWAGIHSTPGGHGTQQHLECSYSPRSPGYIRILINF